MTCRIRAGEVARPRKAASPQGLLGAERLRTGDPSCLGPPLLPIHSCRPVIRAAAGLGVRPDRPAAVAGACRQTGILAHRCPKIPMEPEICGVTHHSPVRVDTAPFELPSRRRGMPGPGTERLFRFRRYARCATPAGRKKDTRLRQQWVRRLVRFNSGPDDSTWRSAARTALTCVNCPSAEEP